MVVEWEENSQFFNAAMNGQRRANAIPYMVPNGVVLHSHDAKCSVLFDFYHDNYLYCLELRRPCPLPYHAGN